jgi:hypothetical protein
VTVSPLLRAAIVPATFVPWPLSSWAGVPGLMQLVPLAALRSALLRSMPVSSTATALLAGGCAWVSVAAPIRWIPTGTVSPVVSA